MNEDRKALLRSLLAHLLILSLVFIFKGSAGSNSNNQNKKDSKSIVDKKIEIEVEKEIPKPIETSEIVQSKPKPVKKPYKGRDCGNSMWFGGIGVTLDVKDGYAVAEIVHRGYPAQKAGIQKGDIILNPNDLKGEPGTEVVAKLYRDYRVESIKIMRDKICIE